MKKFLIMLSFLAFLLVFASQTVMAGGDQVTGDNAAGPANQYGDCPFTGTDY